MIPNQWYAICTSQELNSKKPHRFIRFNQSLVVWRNEENSVVAMQDQCCHRGMALSKGTIVNNCIKCPYHGFEFDSTGQCQLIPAQGKDRSIPSNFRVAAYITREAHGFIWMWWGDPQENYPELPWFEELDGCVSHTSPPVTLACHYTLIIENLLDITHLPIAHEHSFGSVISPIIDILENTEWDGTRLKIRSSVRFKKNSLNKYLDVTGREDDGSPPLKTLEQGFDYSQEPFDAQFRFPGTWRVSFNIRLLGHLLRKQFYSSVAICPVDEETSVIYITAHQRFIKIPLLGKLICKVANNYDLRVGFEEDRVSVENQFPKKSHGVMNQKLIEADGPIVFYRKQRQALIEQAADSSVLSQPHTASFTPQTAASSKVNGYSTFVAGCLLSILSIVGIWGAYSWQQASSSADFTESAKSEMGVNQQ